jgi:hypothetical protein
MRVNRKGEDYAAFSQPGVKEWLQLLVDESVKTKRAPLVLVHTGKHYDCVIFDRAKPATAVATKKLKTAKLNELWNKAASTRSTAPAAPTRPTSTSRKQVIDSSVKVTEMDMFSFLLDNGWSTDEKKEIVDILVSGDVNYKQLLTFTTAASATASEVSSESTPAGTRKESSDFVPSDSDEASTTATPSPTLAEQGSKEYRQWADEMWRGVQDEWHQQTNMVLPDLLDTAGLTGLIDKDPEVLLEVGRWCDNPLTMLEHIPMKTIQAWMEPRWVRLCIACFESITEDIMDAVSRPVLDAWIAGVKAAPSHKDQRKAMRERSKWTLMKQHVPAAFMGRTANPLLKYDYKTKRATILVLDALLPDLARQILGNAGWQGDLDTATLVTAYQYVGEFRKVIDQAEKDDEWDPVERYYNALQPMSGEAAARC